MRKVYDAFTFFNEFDLLELRLEELNDYVDAFILVESDHTFTNIPKPYYFEENKHRYSKYLHKIRHIKVQSKLDSNPWENEFQQRNAILNGCYNINANDMVMISDVDEIPRPSTINDIRSGTSNVYTLSMPYFYYKYNYVSLEVYLPTSVVINMNSLLLYTPQILRNHRFSMNEIFEYENIEHAGWHFGWLGDNDFVKLKLKSFSHAPEHNENDIEQFDVNASMVEYKGKRCVVKIDSYFPQSLLNNLSKYNNYIIPEAEKTMREVFNIY